jgi:hypothetical protein
VKKVILVLVAAALLAFAGTADALKESQLKMRFIRTTSDTAIDSLAVAPHQRVFINYIFAWYDNAANTNNINIELVEGMTAMAVQGSGRIYRHSQAMTSSGITSLTLSQPYNIITAADSTVYLSISATGSDSLIVGYTYTLVAD